MPTEKQICDELDKVTGTLSTNLRFLTIGLLAFTGGLLISDSEFARQLPTWVNARLFGVALLCLVTLLLDVLQYVGLYWSDRATLTKLENRQKEAKKAEQPPPTTEDFDPTHMGRRIADVCFVGKIAVLLAAATWLVVFASVYLREKLA